LSIAKKVNVKYFGSINPNSHINGSLILTALTSCLHNSYRDSTNLGI